jgi:hypothetical protein
MCKLWLNAHPRCLLPLTGKVDVTIEFLLCRSRDASLYALDIRNYRIEVLAGSGHAVDFVMRVLVFPIPQRLAVGDGLCHDRLDVWVAAAEMMNEAVS